MSSFFLNEKPLAIFVILAEKLEGWQNPITERGKIILEKHYAWGQV